jgi:hypothetical protein
MSMQNLQGGKSPQIKGKSSSGSSNPNRESSLNPNRYQQEQIDYNLIQRVEKSAYHGRKKKRD